MVSMSASNPNRKVRVVDTFSFNGEWIVQLRLKYLYDHVDEFVIVESRYTHAGEKKEALYKEQFASWFEPYAQKIHWIVIDEFPEMTNEWFNTYRVHDWMKSNHTSWFREAYQRDVAGAYIKEKYPIRVIIHTGDADEIPHIELFAEAPRENLYGKMLEVQEPIYLEMEFFYYNFHWKKKQNWYRAYLLPGDLLSVNTSLTYWRIHHAPQLVLPLAGWHFSYFMTIPDLQRKLVSFAHRECDRTEWHSVKHIRECLQTGKDLFGRDGSEDMEETPESVYQRFPVLYSTFIVDLDKLQESTSM